MRKDFNDYKSLTHRQILIRLAKRDARRWPKPVTLSGKSVDTDKPQD